MSTQVTLRFRRSNIKKRRGASPPVLQWDTKGTASYEEGELRWAQKDTESPNAIIKGDNLHALSALQEEYAAAVKCIYIDPPYNVGQLFKHYGDRRASADWLEWMRVRLELMRELLQESGSIWISIDDDEGHYLKVLCDEIFGRRNFVANVIWQKKNFPQNDAKFLTDNHDHILVYAKNKSVAKANRWLLPRAPHLDERYTNRDDDPRGRWAPQHMTTKTYSARNRYPIITPSGREVWPPPGRAWRYSRKRFETMRADDRIWFGVKGDAKPTTKSFLSEVLPGSVCKTIWTIDEVGSSTDATKDEVLRNGAHAFINPKPIGLVQRILQLCTQPRDLVLDAFAGSGTTGEAAHIMERNWILIEQGEHCDTHTAARMANLPGCSFRYAHAAPRAGLPTANSVGTHESTSAADAIRRTPTLSRHTSNRLAPEA